MQIVSSMLVLSLLSFALRSRDRTVLAFVGWKYVRRTSGAIPTKGSLDSNWLKRSPGLRHRGIVQSTGLLLLVVCVLAIWCTKGWNLVHTIETDTVRMGTSMVAKGAFHRYRALQSPYWWNLARLPSLVACIQRVDPSPCTCCTCVYDQLLVEVMRHDMYDLSLFVVFAHVGHRCQQHR